MSTTSRSGRSRTALATIAFLSLLLSGCGNSDTSSTDDPTPSATGTSSTSSSPSPSDTVAPAKGAAVDTTFFTAYAPQGWKVNETVPDFAIVALAPGADHSFISWGIVKTYGHPFTLEELAKRDVKNGIWSKPPSILANSTIDGQPVYHLGGPVGDGLTADVFSALYRERQVVLDIETEATGAAHQAIVDSVLANWHWK